MVDQVIVNEIRKSIDGYVNYQVSNIGRVRNSKTGRILKLQTDKDNYYVIGLTKDGAQKFMKFID